LLNWLAPVHALKHDVTDIGFVLDRLQPDWIVIFAFEGGKENWNVCGIIQKKEISKTAEGENFTFRIAEVGENSGCENERQISGTLKINVKSLTGIKHRMAILDIGRTTRSVTKGKQEVQLRAVMITKHSLDYYVIDPATRLKWKVQIRPGQGAFQGSNEQISDYETRHRHGGKFPLTYFPELGLSSGVSGFPSGNKYYWENQFSADYRPENFLHAHILFDFSYAGASTDENATLILPDRLLKTGLGLGWRFPINTWFALDFVLSGVSIFYRYLSAESDWAHRPGIRFKLGLDFPILRANRDFYKLSILLEPYALGIINKTPFSVDWTYQLGALIGLRYAY
jgi:hypothetical protein